MKRRIIRDSYKTGTITREQAARAVRAAMEELRKRPNSKEIKEPESAQSPALRSTHKR